MKTKVTLVFALLLLVGTLVTESDAFTAGGGGNLPRGFGKREKEVSCCFQNRLLLLNPLPITGATQFNCFVFFRLGCLSQIVLVLYVLWNF